MARGDTPTSPWLSTSADYLGRTVTLTISYVNGTGVLLAGSAVRQAGCLYGHMYFGLGADGTPDTSTRKFPIPVGTTNVSAAQLSSVGLNNITDVNALQFTVGP